MFTQGKASKDKHLLLKRTQDVSDQAHPRKGSKIGLADLNVQRRMSDDRSVQQGPLRIVETDIVPPPPLASGLWLNPMSAM